MKTDLKTSCHILEETHFTKGLRFFAGIALILLLGLAAACRTVINDPQYAKFETAATKILQSSGEVKKQEIDIFLTKWSKYNGDNWYKKVLTRRQDLVKRAEDNLISDLSGAEENPALSAEENVRRAEIRKHAYEKAMKQYTVGDKRWKELSTQADKAERDKLDWERYLKLEEFYKKVGKASEQEKLKLCDDFLTNLDWKPKYFPKKENYFKEIEQQKNELQQKLAGKLNLSEKKPAVRNDFQAWKKLLK